MLDSQFNHKTAAFVCSKRPNGIPLGNTRSRSSEQPCIQIQPSRIMSLKEVPIKGGDL
jgi:hypothetical protein